MSTLATFLALGGGAWAVMIGRNDVGAREIAPNAVGSSELKNNAAKGRDVKESSLAAVPEAERAAVADRLGRFGANGLSRVAFANTADGLAAGPGGTMLTASLTAPGPGFITIVASAEASYPGGNVSDQFECFLELDESALANSVRVLQANGAVGSEENCATNATRHVGSGRHKVDLEASNVGDADFGPAELSVIFTPFGPAGATG